MVLHANQDCLQQLTISLLLCRDLCHQMIMPVTPLPAEPRDGGLVGFKNAAMECNEDCGTFRVPVSRTQGSQGPVEIEITTMDGSANEIVDYIPPKYKLLRWEDGDTEDKFIEIGIIDDDFTTEGDETFHICIEGLLDGDVGIGTQKVTITIKDIPRERAGMWLIPASINV